MIIFNKLSIQNGYAITPSSIEPCRLFRERINICNVRERRIIEKFAQKITYFLLFLLKKNLIISLSLMLEPCIFKSLIL